MSTLKVDTIQNTSGVESALIKAWFNGDTTGTVSLRDDLNVDNITDQSLGQYQINFSITFTDNDYCQVAMTGVTGGYGNSYAINPWEDLSGASQLQTKTTSTCQISTTAANNAYADTGELQAIYTR
jgi:hypothetical protein